MEQVKINLAAVRVNAGMGQSEWAAHLGVSKETVKNWEAGKTLPNINQVRTMSDLSGIPIDFIFAAPQSNLNELNCIERKEVNT